MKKARWLALILAALVLLNGCMKPAASTETDDPPSTGIEEQTKTKRAVPPSSSEGTTANAQPTDADEYETVSAESAKITLLFELEEKEPDVAENAPDKQPTQENVQSPTAQPEQTTQPSAPVQEPEPPSPVVAAPPTTTVETPTASEPTPPPTVPTAPEPTPAPDPVPVPEPAPAFDISACVQSAVDYGVSIGIAFDSTATACWDDPLTANAQSLYTERDLHDRLDWYKASGFTAFCVWSEPVGDGSYLVYIGYA